MCSKFKPIQLWKLQIREGIKQKWKKEEDTFTTTSLPWTRTKAIQRIRTLSPTHKPNFKNSKSLKPIGINFTSKNLQVCCHPFCATVPFVTIVITVGLEAKNIVEAPLIFFQTTKQSSTTFTASLPLTTASPPSPPWTYPPRRWHLQPRLRQVHNTTSPWTLLHHWKPCLPLSLSFISIGAAAAIP